MVSWYSMFKHITPDFEEVRQEDSNKRARALLVELRQNAPNFEQFVMWPRGKGSDLLERFYFNQLDYISEDGSIIVDRIIRFELLDQQFHTLAKEIGLNGELPHTNKSKREKNYRKYYNEVTKKVLFKRFKRDFKSFGYEF